VLSEKSDALLEEPSRRGKVQNRDKLQTKGEQKLMIMKRTCYERGGDRSTGKERRASNMGW